MSSTCTSRRVRSTCARKSWPRPAPSLAPSIRPGMSASTSWRSLAFEHAEHRRERRERIVGDLRRGARQPREQRGLAGVRQPDEADVGEQLQLQLEPPFLARQAALGKARRLAGGRREALVALAARAAARRRSRAGPRRAAPSDARRARRPRPRRRRRSRCPAARAIVSVSPSAPWRCEPSPCPPRPARWCVFAPERLQVAQRVVADEHDVAAAAAVAAVGAAARHVRFAAEAHAAVAAGAGLDVDSRAIVQHRRPS